MQLAERKYDMMIFLALILIGVGILTLGAIIDGNHGTKQILDQLKHKDKEGDE